MSNPHRGATFDSFLEEQGVLEEIETAAIREVLAWQLQEQMNRQKISKVAMAARMGTSRSQLDRLLNPDDSNITLDTIQRAAKAVGRRVRIQLVDDDSVTSLQEELVAR